MRLNRERIGECLIILPSYGASDTEYTSTITRIFSKGSFELGGRLYAPIQNYTKQTRKYFYLNGEPTIEIDYSCIHPHMLYHGEGLEFDSDDPYAIEGFDTDSVKSNLH